jgi:hypothetical protein
MEAIKLRELLLRPFDVAFGILDWDIFPKALIHAATTRQVS